ncbi:MAG: hypothetical protein PWR13_1418 [Archaeoglobi archaeon]|nr:hypothetical protein [Candidatus Mnemosynella bozhongmuii]MDI3502299.1 hypothetical protein [Archaeoglobi archaeon]MDK2782390.1 hypothetical protein [Archaeoglobi archaeon]
MSDYIGILGLILITLGFGYEMVGTVKRRKCNLSRGVLLLFISASLLLFYHAFQLGDIVFMSLNLIVTFINLVNLYFS